MPHLLQPVENVPQRLPRPVLRQEALHAPGSEKELPVEVRLREAIQSRVELDRLCAVVQFQGIQLGGVVAAHLSREDAQTFYREAFRVIECNGDFVFWKRQCRLESLRIPDAVFAFLGAHTSGRSQKFTNDRLSRQIGMSVE